MHVQAPPCPATAEFPREYPHVAHAEHQVHARVLQRFGDILVEVLAQTALAPDRPPSRQIYGEGRLTKKSEVYYTVKVKKRTKQNTSSTIYRNALFAPAQSSRQFKYARYATRLHKTRKTLHQQGPRHTHKTTSFPL